MKKPTALQRLENLQEKLKKLREWCGDFRLRLDQNSAKRTALNLSRVEDRSMLDELLVEEDALKKEFELFRKANDELMKEVEELLAPYRRRLN